MTMATSKPAPAGTLKYLHDLIVKKDEQSISNMIDGMPAPWRALWDRIVNGYAYCDRKGYGPEALNDFLESDEVPVLEHSDASKLIEQLKVMPWASGQRVRPGEVQAPARPPVTEAGMYKRGDTIYKVQKAVHGSGNLYAKKLVVEKDYRGLAPRTENNPEGLQPAKALVSFVYAPGAIKQLSSEDKLSYEDAKAFGALYGTCCMCGRTLTHELSIALGIGPVCGGRQFGGEFQAMIDAAKLEVQSAKDKLSGKFESLGLDPNQYVDDEVFDARGEYKEFK